MSHADEVRRALPEAESKLFFKLLNQYGLSEDDDRFVMLAAVAPMLERLDQISLKLEAGAAAYEGGPKAIADAFRSGSQSLRESVEDTVLKAIGGGVDAMAAEVKAWARDLALSEYNAASQIRSSAIRDEVAGLKATMEQYVQSGVTASGGTVSPGGGWLERVSYALVGMGLAVVVMLVLHVHR
ncbi:MAG: hypothetical protein ACYDHD_00175 [Vulcanimicrobiaceae bacterium]